MPLVRASCRIEALSPCAAHQGRAWAAARTGPADSQRWNTTAALSGVALRSAASTPEWRYGTWTLKEDLCRIPDMSAVQQRDSDQALAALSGDRLRLIFRAGRQCARHRQRRFSP